MEAQLSDIGIKKKIWLAIKTNNDNLPVGWFERIISGSLEILSNGKLYVPSNLERALKRKYITEEQCRAGTQLYYDAIHAQPLKGINYADYSLGSSSGGHCHAQRVIDAARRLREAMNADLGRLGRKILKDVCIEGKTATEWEKFMGFRDGFGNEMLREALTVLVAHYQERGVRF